MDVGARGGGGRGGEAPGNRANERSQSFPLTIDVGGQNTFSLREGEGSQVVSGLGNGLY